MKIHAVHFLRNNNILAITPWLHNPAQSSWTIWAATTQMPQVSFSFTVNISKQAHILFHSVSTKTKTCLSQTWTRRFRTKQGELGVIHFSEWIKGYRGLTAWFAAKANQILMRSLSSSALCLLIAGPFNSPENIFNVLPWSKTCSAALSLSIAQHTSPLAFSWNFYLLCMLDLVQSVILYLLRSDVTYSIYFCDIGCKCYSQRPKARGDKCLFAGAFTKCCISWCDAV